MTSDSDTPPGASNPQAPGEIHFWTALGLEARTIRHALGMGKPPAGAETAPLHTPSGWTVRITVIGPKGIHIPDPAATRRARLVVLAGFAGGLDPALAVGDVVVDGIDPIKPVEGPWTAGRIVTQAKLVTTPSAKSLLHKQIGALAVDMESDAARRAAMLAGVPLLIVRAITDTAAEAINPAALTWIGPTGQIRAGALSLGLLRRPWLILELIRLWRSSRLAGKRLADAVQYIVVHVEEFTAIGSGN